MARKIAGGFGKQAALALALAYGEAVRQLAGQYQAILVDTQAAFDVVLAAVHPMALASGRAHPNLAGHMF
jgi:predicted component of type VI protein secretion system